MNEQLAAYTGFMSAFMPLVVACIVQSHWSKELKGAFALVFSVVGGIASVHFSGADLHDLGLVIPAILIASQASYHTFWKPTGLVPCLEQCTNLNGLNPRLDSSGGVLPPARASEV
jgi:hypothetical protein